LQWFQPVQVIKLVTHHFELAVTEPKTFMIIAGTPPVSRFAETATNRKIN
jgi:hypothetical protein